MIGPGCTECHGQLRLSSPADTTCTEKDTFYKIAGTFADGDAYGFEVVDNKLKYIGQSGPCFLFNGASDVQVNKACTATYALYKNGSIVEHSTTPHTFLSPSKTSNISITAIMTLNQNDELDVYCKSDTAGTVLSVKTLNITLWGSV